LLHRSGIILPARQTSNTKKAGAKTSFAPANHSKSYNSGVRLNPAQTISKKPHPTRRRGGLLNENNSSLKNTGKNFDGTLVHLAFKFHLLL
jgi:hypothetical protein